MRLLLDSNALLWWLDHDAPLDPDVRAMVDDVANQVAVSAATVWELGIKAASGKLRVPANLLELLDAQEVDVLGVTALHGAAAAALPLHHRDPFDRMLVAQAKLDDYVLVTADRRLADYGVATVAAR